MTLKTILIKELFPHLKLKDKNNSLFKKFYIYSSILIEIWMIIFIFLYMLLPYIAQDTYKNNNMIFYQYKKSNNENTSHYFSKIEKTLSTNTLYSKKVNIDFYLFTNKYMYKIFNPIEWLPNRQTFAVTQSRHIFVKNADITKNKAYASNNTYENLDAILVHEAIHVFQNAKYGWIYTSFKMPYWVKEGYPIYSARSLSLYGEKEIIEYMLKTKDTMINKWTPFVQDQFYGLMVKHAIEKMHKTVDELHEGKVDFNEVWDSLLVEYNTTKEEKR